MALIDKASLLMVPSTYEDGTLYNILPSGNKAPDETGNHNGYDQTRADFTFSRGFNLAATRVNADGLIEKGRENLLLQSNQFDTTWVNISSTETSGQEGYDGTNNAWLLTKNATNGRIQQSITGTGVYTFSVYAKAGVNNWCTLIADFVSGTDVIVWFDLQNGIVGTESGSPIESKISSIDNGWYRISISFTCPASLQTLRIYVADGDNDNSGTSGSIYIQDAQLEYGLTASSYLDSGATTATAGVLENTPRIDYSSGTGALLLEPQRTNVLAYSEYFNASGVWLPNTITITDNYGTSPEGVQNSTRLVLGNLTASRIAYAPSLTDGTTYTFSCYYKGTAGEKLYMEGNGSGGSGTQTSKLITLTGEWQREDLQFVGGSSSNLIYIVDSRNGTEDSATDFEVYGAMLEAASHASSYVPTYGSAATRGADSCSVTGVSDVIGQTEGTLYAEVDWNVNPESGSPVIGIVSLNNGANNLQNSILLGIERQSGGTNRVYCFVINSNVTQAEIYGSGITDGTYKIAFAYKANDFALYVNGTQIGTDTSGSVPALNEVFLGKRFGTDTYIQADGTKQAVLFDTRLTNSELATLTTL